MPLRPRLPLDPCIDILGVLPEDNHVHLLRVLHWARGAGNILHRPDAGIEIESLAEQNIDASNPSSHGRGERSFDPDFVFSNRLDRLLRSPFPFQLKGLLSCIDFEPLHLSLDSIAFFTAASKTRTDALQISGPTPSPSI